MEIVIIIKVEAYYNYIILMDENKKGENEENEEDDKKNEKRGKIKNLRGKIIFINFYDLYNYIIHLQLLPLN